MSKYRSKVVLQVKDQEKIEALKVEIQEFQRSLRNSFGKLPINFNYPKSIIERVVELQKLDLCSHHVAIALGLSISTVTRWFNLRKMKAKTPGLFLRELKIQDPLPVEKHQDCARIVFKSGVVIELQPQALTQEIISWIGHEVSDLRGGLK